MRGGGTACSEQSSLRNVDRATRKAVAGGDRLMQPAQKSLPVWMRKRAAEHQRRAKTITACEASMTKRMGRPPSEQELASILAMTVDKLRQVRGS